MAMVRRGLAWRVMLTGAALAAITAAVAGPPLRRAALQAELIRADPDAVPMDAALRRFAIAEARPVFAANCASCHGADRRGDPARGVPDLTRGVWLYGTGRVAELERTILYGIRAGLRSRDLADMPAFAQPQPTKRYDIAPLAPAEIDDLVVYVRQRAEGTANSAAADRGAALFAGRGQCFDCHAGDARGDNAIGAPDLSAAVRLYGDGSAQSIWDSIAHGRAGSCLGWRGRLPAAAIRALAVMIRLGAEGVGS